MVEAPLEIQKTHTIPENHLDACRAGNLPFAGNAAANTNDHFNLKGATRAPNPLPTGFTAKGIVAMTFSVVAALLGLAVISWYVSRFPSKNSLVNNRQVRTCRYGRSEQSFRRTEDCRDQIIETEKSIPSNLIDITIVMDKFGLTKGIPL